MLKKKNRVDRKTIDKIFQEGRFINGENLVFKFIFNKKSHLPAVSFVAPKGVCKSAVKRNALRRRGYAVLEKYLKDLPKDISGVFIFGKKSLELFAGRKHKNYNPNTHLEYEIKNILGKIN
mgnify:FL=1